MKRLLTIVLISSVMKISAQDSTGLILPLEKALEITFEKNHALNQSKLLINEKEQLAKATKGLMLPKIGLSANYMRMSDDLTLDLTPVKDAITPLYTTLSQFGKFSGVPNPDPKTNTIMPILPDEYSTKAVRGKLAEGLQQIESAEWNKMIQKKEFATIAANAQWPLYAGGKIRIANKVSKIEKQEADEALIQKQGELSSELVERYFGLCLANQAINVRMDVLNGVKHHLDDAIKLQNDGMIANADVLQAKLYYANAERELKKAERNAFTINQALLNTLSIDNGTNVIPSTELFYLDSVETVDYFLAMAIKNNPSLKQVETKKQLAQQNYKANISNYLPTIAAMGMYDLWNKDLSEYSPEWMVGITLNYSILDGSTRFRKLKAAKIKTEQVDEFQQKAESDINTVITKLYNELQINIEQLKALESSMEFANELVRVREKAFKEEMSNSTEVVDAELTLAQVRIERLQAIYNYDVCLAKILQYAGIPDKFTSYQQSAKAIKESYIRTK